MCKAYYSVKPGVSGQVHLEDLRKSKSAVGRLGKVSPVMFIDEIINSINNAGLAYEEGDVYYKNNAGSDPGVYIFPLEKEHPDFQEKYKPKIINEGKKDATTLHHPGILLFKRMIGNIKLTGYQDDEQIGTIAFNISQRGFELAIGNEVKICSNMCIMSANHRVNSYEKGNSMDPEKMIEELDHWLLNYKSIYENNLRKMELLKGAEVDTQLANQILGDLHHMAIINNSPDIRKKIDNNVLSIPHNIINKAHGKFIEESIIGDRKANLWEIYNDVTYFLKAENADTLGLIKQNGELAEHLIEYAEEV